MNILEQKRKLLGHCYMGGGGSSSGGGGAGGDARAGMGFAGTGSGLSGSGAAAASRGEGGGQGGGRDAADRAREAAEAAAAEDANRQAIQAEADKAAREQAARDAAKAADARMAAEQAARDQAARDQAARDQAEQASREQAAREARDAQMAAEQASREQAARDAQAESDRASAAAEAARAVEAKNAAAASLNQAAVVNPALSALTGVSLSDSQQAALDKKTASNEVRDAVNAKLAEMSGTEKYNQLKYGFDAANDPAAKVEAYKSVMGDLTKQTMTLGANKNGEDRVVSVDVPTNSWVDAFGASPSYAEAKALQAAGLGNITGVNANNLTSMNTPVQGVEGLFTNDPGQTADSVVAATDFTNFMTPIAKAAAMFIPGASLAMTLNDLYTGKTTLGDITSNFALGLLAKHLGINVNVAKAVINGDFGGALASTMIGQLNPALAKELGINPRLASIIGKETGAYNALSKAFDNAFSGFDQSSWGSNTKDFANTINTGFQNLGITTGTGGKDGATGQALNLGFGADDAMNNYLGTNNGGPTLGAPTPSSTTPSITTPSITAPTKPVTTPTTPSITTPTTPIAPGVGTTGTGASTISTQGNLFNPLGLTAPQTQQMTNAFPQLANVFYYGKDTGSKKQKLDENNQLVFEDAEQGLASGGRIADNKDDAIDAYIRHIVEQSGGPMSHRELLAIVKGI